ncbi:hypothetical protein SLEP1_g2924 [Rubroshorea leprosula]|uniref:Bromo domain-containing protein n=1 Tax=Rubroshorea leprosula TaxID=152421 RepID=A0AAV5HT17_9ROSI|nr:hypothetical protein SLEP1_g2924 [Rubroshorea leprosula]
MAQQTQPCSSWGTWEELLLASAVKRHGVHNWDSVSMELRTKTSLPRPLTTAQICQQKYRDLQRRFTANHPQDQTPSEIPWLEDLRKLRVAELKRDLHRYDVSIVALQHKVKKLEEERERTLSTSQDAEDKPDLGRGSETDKTPPAEIPQPGKVPGNSVSGEEENRSVNGSNSTGSERREKEKTDPDPVRAGQGEVVADSTGSEELGELSSDVQSSASLGKKRKRRRVELCGGDGIKDKSEASVGLLEKIRAHGESGLFERRLQSQESEDYKDLVRQHVDLETIQARLIQGSYASSSSLAFYRDLLLLFTNSIVFFPKLSHESLTAHHLRNLVLDHVNKLTNKSDSSHDQPPSPAPPKPDLENSDSLLARHKSSAPIIVCRKRSSVSTKPSSSAFTLKASDQPQPDDNKKPPPVESSLLKPQEKPITTGTRSSRRISNNNNNNNNIKKPSNTDNTTPNGKQNASSPPAKIEMQDDSTPSRAEKKKMEVSASDKEKCLADYLKKMKKNSPAAEVKKNSKGGEQKKKKKKKNNNNNNSSSSNGKKEKGKEKVMTRRSVERKQGKEETSPSKRSVGRPPKREAEASGGSGKRGRKEAKQPRKRARR